jgi:hypothetical protein
MAVCLSPFIDRHLAFFGSDGSWGVTVDGRMKRSVLLLVGVSAYRFFRGCCGGPGRDRREKKSRRKKKLGRCPRGATAQPRIPQESPKRPRGRQPSHVHVTVACLYSEAWLAVAHLRSARVNFHQPLTPEGVVPIGFCSGGFTSTSSLRSGQRGSTEVERHPLPRWLIFPSERRRVFIRAARETPVGLLSAQAFRLRRERQWQQT